MKKSIKILKNIIGLLVVISLTQCDEDDVTPKTINTVKMDGNDFAIVSASMIGVSSGDFGHTYISFVNSSGTQANCLNIGVDSFIFGFRHN